MQKNPTLYVCLRIVAGILIGVVAGFLLKPRLEKWLLGAGDSEAQPASNSSLAPSDRPVNPSRSPHSSKRTESGPEFEKAAATDRWLWLASQAEHAKPSQIPRLIRLAGDDKALVTMLAAQWIQSAPAHMFRTLSAEMKSSPASTRQADELLRRLIREWAKSDPSAVAEALSGPDISKALDGHRMTAAHTLMKEDPALGLQMMKEWDIQHYIPGMGGVEEWAKTEPRAAAELASQIPGEHARREALSVIGKSWALLDPSAALEFASSIGGAAGNELGWGVMKTWAENDIEAAVTFVSNHDDAQLRSNIGSALVEVWSRADPAAALEWSQSNLNAPARAEAVASVIGAIAEKDIDSAAGIVTDMAPGGLRNTAASQLLESWIKRKDPSSHKAIGKWLASITDQDTRDKALASVEWRWTYENPEGAMAFLNSEHGDLSPAGLIRKLAEIETRKNPEAALDWAASLGGSRSDSAKKGVIDAWLKTQPDSAMQWAASLINQKERNQAIETVSRGVLFTSEDRLRQWVELLPTVDRERARAAMHGMRPSERYAERIENVFGG